MKSFYRKIQDKLYAHRSSVDTDDLWQQINAEIHPKKKRRLLFWWGFGILLLLGGGMAIWQFSPASLSEEDLLVSTPIAEISGDKDSPSSLPSPTSIESRKIDRKSPLEKIVNSPITKAPSVPFSQKTPQESSSKPTTATSFSDQKTLVFSSKRNKPIDSGYDSISQSSIKSFANKIIQDKQESVVKTNAVGSLPSAIIATRLSTAVPSSRDTIQFTDVSPFSLFKRSKNSSIALGIHASLFRPSSQLKAVEEYKNLLNDRVATETPLEGIELGLSISYFSPKGFYLRTGISFTQINEQFEWQNTSYRRDTLTGVLLQVELSELGDTLSKSFGDGLGTTTTSYQATVYNSVRLLDIPLIAGYRFQRSAWHFGLETGVYFNLYQMAEGRILDINQQARELETTSVLKKRVGLSLYGAMRISYQLTDQWAISFAPNLRYQLGRNTREEYELEQQYHLFGMQVGVGYGF